MDAKARAAEAVAEARRELDRAVAEIDMIQTYNPTLIGLVAHSLSNYVAVTSAAVEMLQLSLRGVKDPDVPMWLEGIGHTADLMQHSVGRLVSMSAPRDFPLKLDRVNVSVLMERACEYYRRRSGTTGPHVTCVRVGQVPLAWGDRVALAVVADNLLSNALRVSGSDGTVRVHVAAEPGFLVCRVQDSGPGLTKEEQERLFGAPALPAVPPDAIPVQGYGVAVSKEFLERMDGELTCESEPGHGAGFIFRVPAIE
jgi:signal transduction histidine kinase